MWWMAAHTSWSQQWASDVFPGIWQASSVQGYFRCIWQCAALKFYPWPLPRFRWPFSLSAKADHMPLCALTSSFGPNFSRKNDQRKRKIIFFQSSIRLGECYPCNWGSCLFVSAAMTDTLLIQCKSIGQSLFTAIGISPEPISGDRGINGLGIEARSWKWS